MSEEIQELRDQLEKLQQENREIYQELGRNGGVIDPSSIMMMRLETLLDSILDEENRLRFETRFESIMNEQLKASKEKMNTAKLTQGTPAAGQQQQSSGLWVAK